MKEQILIIGLGQFGMSLARNLSEKDFDVIVADINQKMVNDAANFVTDAICIDAIDEISLSKLSPKERDMVICKFFTIFILRIYNSFCADCFQNSCVYSFRCSCYNIFTTHLF